MIVTLEADGSISSAAAALSLGDLKLAVSERGQAIRVNKKPHTAFAGASRRSIYPPGQTVALV